LPHFDAVFTTRTTFAWAERAVRLKPTNDTKIKVRLSFVADNWRFDQVAVAAVDAAGATGRIVPQIEQLYAARQAAAARVVLHVAQADSTKNRQFAGELLAVRQDGVIISMRPETADATRVAFVPWTFVKIIDATELPGFHMNLTHNAQRQKLAVNKFAIVSRYPQGLSEELLASLLARSGQAAMDAIE